MSRTGQPGHVRKQVLSRPDLIREFTPKVDRMVRETVDHKTALEVKQVFGFGCGDSHNAAVATRMAFQEWAKVPMEAPTALQFARYTAPWLASERPKKALAAGISVSGEVARTVEAVTLGNEAGAYTVGITCNKDSKIADLADMVLDVTIPDMDIPRIRTYVATQLAMYMIALRLAEVNDRISYKEAQEIRGFFEKAADVAQATHEVISDTVRQLAQDVGDKDQFYFVGGGPNFGSAMFSAAKILEAEGSHAQPQDLEEWVHLQRFVKEPKVPTFLIAPPGLSYSRAIEVARVMDRVDAFLIAVVQEGEQEISKLADVVLPIQGELPEEFTPLVYSDPMEMFSSDLAEVRDEPYFRGFEGRFATPDGDPIWHNEIVETRSGLDFRTSI